MPLSGLVGSLAANALVLRAGVMRGWPGLSQALGGDLARDHTLAGLGRVGEALGAAARTGGRAQRRQAVLGRGLTEGGRPPTTC